MQTFQSSLLFAGKGLKDAEDLGAHTVLEYEELEKQLSHHRYAVIVFGLDHKMAEQLKDISTLLKLKNSNAQIVLVHHGLPVSVLQDAINRLTPFKVLPHSGGQDYKTTVQDALERYSLFEQNHQLLGLINSQNERLKRLSHDLENRVEKRQKYLTSAKKKAPHLQFPCRSSAPSADRDSPG